VVGRGPGGSEEVRKAVGKCGRDGKAQEVTVHYTAPENAPRYFVPLSLASAPIPMVLRHVLYNRVHHDGVVGDDHSEILNSVASVTSSTA